MAHGQGFKMAMLSGTFIRLDDNSLEKREEGILKLQAEGHIFLSIGPFLFPDWQFLIYKSGKVWAVVGYLCKKK